MSCSLAVVLAVSAYEVVSELEPALHSFASGFIFFLHFN
jgi:hypothetical protein